VWLAASAASGFLAMTARQNAAPLVFFVVLAMVQRGLSRRAGQRGDGRVWRTRALSLAAAAGLCIAATLVINVLTYRVFETVDRQPEAVVYAYDLTAMSLEEDELLLGPEAFPAQDLEILEANFDPQYAFSVIIEPEQGGVLATIGGPPTDELAADWRAEVPAHFGTYLTVRWRMFDRVIGLTERPVVIVHHGVDPNGGVIEIENPGANRWFRSNYLRVLATDDTLIYGTGWARPVWYLLVAAAASAVLLRRRRRAAPGGLEVGLLALGALAYTASLFFVTPTAEYRFAYPSITLGLLSGAFAVLVVAEGRGARTDDGSSSAEEPSAEEPSLAGVEAPDPEPAARAAGASFPPPGADHDRTTDGSAPRANATSAARNTPVSKQIGTADDM
jgi:hypothetical protein